MSDEENPANAVPVDAARVRLQPVPRVSIHAFCEDQGTAAAIAAAALDRRLVKAAVTVQMGGVHSAYAFYEKAPTPHLIIVESLLDAGSMLADLERLADVCDRETKVIVIGHLNDVLLYRELIRRHISDYLVAPVNPAQLIESVANVCAGEGAAPLGRVIAFVGAKGGAGSSTVCHNVAWTLAERLASEVVIADFDLLFGTLGLDFNQDSARGIGEALAAGGRLDEAMMAKLLSKCSERLSLLTPPCTLDRDADIDAEAAAHVVALLARSIPFVALDLPRQWTAWVRRLIGQADEIVITAEPDLASLRNTKNLIDTLKAAHRGGRPPFLVLNKVNLPHRPEIAIRDFVNAVDMRPTVVMEFDAQIFGAAANNGQMAGEISANAKPAKAFRDLAAAISGKPVPEMRSGNLVSAVFNRLNRRRAG